MIAESFSARISDDWLWREKELRDLDAQILRQKSVINMKAGIVLTYAHWEGHFKLCASQLLSFIEQGVSRKLFKWTDVRPEIRHRILFCNYRFSSISKQSNETFITYLNALNEDRYNDILKAKDQIIMIDDNLNSMRAEAVCKNLGVEHSWCSLRKIIIDERILEFRNAIAHGSKRLRSGDEIDVLNADISSAIDEGRSLIRETRNHFDNCIITKRFLN